MATVKRRGKTYFRLLDLLSGGGTMSLKSIQEALGVAQSTAYKTVEQARNDRKVYVSKWVHVYGTETGHSMYRLFRAGSRKDAPNPAPKTPAETQKRYRERQKAAKLTEQKKRDWHAKRDEARRVAREAREKAKLQSEEKAMRDADKAIREAARKAQRETVQRVKTLVAQQPRNPFASLMAQV
jgi:hypothetical protein